MAMTSHDSFGRQRRRAAAAGQNNDERVAQELGPGERVLWSGKPDDRHWLYAEDLVLVPFSLLWGGFAIFWEASVIASARSAHGGAGARVFFALWGVPFVLFGLYLIFGRLFTRRWLRRRSQYVLTDRRVLSFSPTWHGGTAVKMIWLRSSPPLEKHIGKDGQGTLCIGHTITGRRWMAGGSGWPGSGMLGGSAIMLVDISDAADVYQQIVRQIAATGGTA
jgi:hypothetical protein